MFNISNLIMESNKDSFDSEAIDVIYGKGASTSLDQTALGKINTGLVFQDAFISGEDGKVLKELAKQVAELAYLPEMGKKRNLWKSHNMLKSVRPLIFCDPENGWNEIITEDQMQCKGTLARRWEMDLRKEIFQGIFIQDDKPIEAVFNVPFTVLPDDWGLDVVFTCSDFVNGSKVWDSPVKDYDRDLPKLHSPDFEIDYKTTNACLKLAKEVFGDILKVELKGCWWWSLGITLPAVMLRGLTNIYMDFIEQPDNIKALFNIIMKGHQSKLDYLETAGLLALNSDTSYVGSGGLGNTDELPGLISGGIKCHNLWGFAESQETVSVSPDMYGEFVFPFEKPHLDRFGLNCYGCCEPIDPRWQYVKQHSNLRRVSCSPWADYEKMAEYLGTDYIFSMKPAPSLISSPNIDRVAIRKQIRHDLEVTKGCIVEIIMKDNHTLGGKPSNIVEWCSIAKEEIANVYGIEKQERLLV